MNPEPETEKQEPTKTDLPEFQWIIDEHLLRDEGVLYGLTQGPAEQKTKAIHDYFQAKIDTIDSEILNTTEDLHEQESTFLEKQDKEKEILADIDRMHEAIPSVPNSYYRTLIGIVGSGLTVIITFIMCFLWLGDSWALPMLVTLGVYLLGGLLLFEDGSIIFHPDREVAPGRARWKLWVEEFVVPFVATAFIIVWGYDGEGFGKVIVTAFLLYAFFLFGGHGFLSYINRFRRQINPFREQMAKRAWYKKTISDLKESLIVIRQEIQALEQRIPETRRRIRDQKQKRAALDKQRDARISLFMSEYDLAKSALGRIGESGLHALIYS